MPTMTRTAELASTMRVSVMRLSRRLRTERADHDLTLTQTAALATLDRHGPLTPRELADHEHVQRWPVVRSELGCQPRSLRMCGLGEISADPGFECGECAVHAASQPPSTTITVPVVKEDASLAR